MICKICLERDGIFSEAVVEHVSVNERTGEQFSAHVCERCLDKGKETRVTCRTFLKRIVPANNS